MAKVIDNRNTDSQLSDFVKQASPSTGRVVSEDGEIINLADLWLGAQGITGAIVQSSLERESINDGAGWNLSVETGDIIAGADYYVLFKVPTGTHAHLRSYSVTTTVGPVYIRLFEDPTVSANGDAATIRNRKRPTGDPGGITVFTEPTVSDDGGRLETSLMPTAANKGGG